MHDLMYANKIIALLKEKFPGKIARGNVKVAVCLSPLSHVTADSLRGAFQTLAEKEGFKNVSLDIEKSEVSIKCRKCAAITKISCPVFTCPACEGADFEILNHQEFLIKSIEID